MDLAGGVGVSSEKVARLLTNFDRTEPAQKARVRVVPFDHVQHSPPRPQPQAAAPAEDDDAYQRGRASGYASALVEFEQRLEEEKDKLNVRLADERRNMLDEAAARISDGIAAAGAQLETKIAGTAARILEPFISNAVQKQAVATFVDQLSSIASDPRRPALRISCPPELLEMLRDKITARAIAVEFRVAPAVEVSVAVDNVLLETRLRLWAERLKCAVLS
jgi:hypothetical protein